MGTWQIQRKKWKEGLIQSMKERTAALPVPLPENLDDVEKLEYHAIHVRGHYLHDKELYMGPRTLLEKGDAATTSQLMGQAQGKSRGYLVITPFKLADRE